MSSTTTLAYAYAGLLALGGVIGFSKGSVASLVAGAGSGAAIAGLEYVIAGAAPSLVSQVSAVQVLAASTLAYVMGSRYAGSGKFMPTGLVAALSLSMVLVFGTRALASRK